MSTIRTTPPELLLGTAMWGWTVEEPDCFTLLDEFYTRGGRRVDSATNYPINKNVADFRRAERILAAWCKQRGVTDLEVIMKIGSLNNLMTPDQNLSPSFLMICADEYRKLLGTNLQCLMIHWDNREEHEAIAATLATLDQLRNSGLAIGLSGIRHPEVYAEALAELGWQDVPIELKHNLIYSDYERYAPLHPYANFIAYGVNAGGLKLDPAAYRSDASLAARGGDPDRHRALMEALRNELVQFNTTHSELPLITNMNQLGMLYAAYHPGIDGILLGPSRVEQLWASWDWLGQLLEENYEAFYHQLVSLVRGAF